MSERQAKVFEAIKKFNMRYLESLILSKAERERESSIISTIHCGTDVWVSKIRLQGVISTIFGEQISLPTLANDLKQLIRLNWVEERKDSRNPNETVYGITTLNLETGTSLPHPSEIADPIYNKAEVQVVNPLTGEVEII